ncbi:hypothetical protein FRC10_004574 [Ceratobasidium sp. 414]|nr:hypothetical protein FRC10_004574 [Ceratobasidium sp. 414]
MAGLDLSNRQGLFRRNGRGFSIHATRNTQYIRNGPKDYAKCIRKFKIGGTWQTPFFFDHESLCIRRYIHERLAADRLQLNIGGNVRVPDVNLDPYDGKTVVQANDIQNDTEYACPVTIGTPGVTLILDFDTGSSDFWVWSSEFRASCSNLRGHNVYDPKKSRTSEPLPGESWEVKYGDGSHASGDVHLDTIVIGDIEIKRQAVEVSQQLSDEFLQGKSDGLLGLAFPRLNTVKPHRQKSPMQNMIEQGLVKDPIFTVKLDKHDSRGFYTFGYIDETVHSSKLFWQPLVQDSDWWEVDSRKTPAVPSAYIKIGSDIYDRGWDNTAIIDTGTTLILLDDATVETLYSRVPGARLDQSQGALLYPPLVINPPTLSSGCAGGYIFPANAQLPSLAFCVGYWLFTVPSGDLAFSDAGNGMSYGAVQSRGQNPQDILGDVFLKHVYVVFDQGKTPRVGVAQRS